MLLWPATAKHTRSFASDQGLPAINVDEMVGLATTLGDPQHMATREELAQFLEFAQAVVLLAPASVTRHATGQALEALRGSDLAAKILALLEWAGLDADEILGLVDTFNDPQHVFVRSEVDKVLDFTRNLVAMAAESGMKHEAAQFLNYIRNVLDLVFVDSDNSWELWQRSIFEDEMHDLLDGTDVDAEEIIRLIDMFSDPQYVITRRDAADFLGYVRDIILVAPESTLQELGEADLRRSVHDILDAAGSSADEFVELALALSDAEHTFVYEELDYFLQFAQILSHTAPDARIKQQVADFLYHAIDLVLDGTEANSRN